MAAADRATVRFDAGSPIKPSHVDDWVVDMIEQGLSVSKITESLGVLKRVLDRVVRDRVIVTNPCSLRAVTLPKRSQMERLVLSVRVALDRRESQSQRCSGPFRS